jgi:REP element-mobilizing transposase RayT
LIVVVPMPLGSPERKHSFRDSIFCSPLPIFQANADLRTPLRARPVAVYHHQYLPPRARFLNPQGFPEIFVEALRAARSKFSFPLVGWVLMPEHFHFLFQPWPADTTPEMIKDLKQRSAHSFPIVNRHSSNRQSADWHWSSSRFYFWGDRSLLEMDRVNC